MLESMVESFVETMLFYALLLVSGIAVIALLAKILTRKW